MNWNSEQIELCKRLYELGPKREPKVGETWAVIFYQEPYQAVLEHNEGNGVWRCDKTRWTEELRHPLYSEGELLEMIVVKLGSLTIIDMNTEFYCCDDSEVPYHSTHENNILTALLKLAIEVMEGK